MDTYEFSVIIPIQNNSYYIDKTIESLINQTLDFKNNVQLILVNNTEKDFNQLILDFKSKYDNILLLSNNNGDFNSARNLGLNNVKGKYITFLDPNDELSPNTLKEVLDFFNKKKEIDVVSIPQYYLNSEKEYVLNYKFINENKIVNLEKDIFDIQISVTSAFIKKEALKNQFFDEYKSSVYDGLFINKILLNKKSYGLIGLKTEAFYLNRGEFDFDSNKIPIKDSKEFFIDKLTNFSKELLHYSFKKEYDFPKFIQSVVVYDLQSLLIIPNIFTNFNEEEITKFLDSLEYILSHIEALLKSPIFYT